MKPMTFNGNKNVVGAKIKEVRKKSKISQNELAAKMQILGVNIDQQAISKIEKNKRIVTDYELKYFSAALKVKAEYLLQDYEEK